jgi:thiol-disulfide isomerase/thioredoxin
MNNIPLVTQQLAPAAFPDPSTAVLLYFSAHWCGPCRQFTPLLKRFYELAKESGAKLEIVFVSSDRTERDMQSYFSQAHGSWLAVQFLSHQRNTLGQQFGVRGIPSLVLLNWGDMQKVDLDIRSTIQQVAMMGNPLRARELVDEWRDRSGAILFESIPSSLSTVSSLEDRNSILSLLTKLIENIALHPTESKYRQLKSDNAIVKKTILDHACGDGPLRAIGFYKDPSSGSFNYRPSFCGPSITLQILQQRETNGLTRQHVSTTQAPIAHHPVSSEKSLEIHYQSNEPLTTEPVAIESFEILQTIIESITDIPNECQLIYIPSIGFITEFSSIQSLSSPIVIYVFARTDAPRFIDDAKSNLHASELRSKITQHKNSISGMNLIANQCVNLAMHMQIYEVPSHIQKALEIIPVLDIHKRSVDDHGSASYTLSFLTRLLKWYSVEFFRLIESSPRCGQCQSFSTVLVNGSAPPTQQEAKGMATVVELYSCEVCGSSIRFPRFNHPVALLHTREGKLEELINCFCLIARAMGFEVRQVISTEPPAAHSVQVWIQDDWVSCDLLNDAEPVPGMAIACAKDGIVDVSKKFTDDYDTYAERVRRVPNLPSDWLSALNTILVDHLSVSESRKTLLLNRFEEEQIAMNLLAHDKRRTPGSKSAESSENGIFFIGANEDIVIVDPVNTGGGSVETPIPFSDEHFIRTATMVPRIERVTVHVHGIELFWSGGVSSSHSAEADGVEKFTLDIAEDDHIVSIALAGSRIVRLTTQNGQSLDVGDGGADMVTLTVPEGYQLAGLVGSVSSAGFSSLGLICSPAPETGEDEDAIAAKFTELVAYGMEPGEAAIEARRLVRG